MKTGWKCLLLFSGLLLPWQPVLAADAMRCASDGAIPPKASNPHVGGAYPLLSKALHEEGATVLDMVIGTDGRVAEAAVAESSGSMRLDDASVDAVRKSWQYVPAQKDGQPIRCRWKAKVVWSLETAPKPSVPASAAHDNVRIEARPLNVNIDEYLSGEKTGEFASLLTGDKDCPFLYSTLVPTLAYYPQDARDRRLEGDVYVIVYSVPGMKASVPVVYKSTEKAFDQTSQKIAVEHAKPGTCLFDNQPTSCQTVVHVRWRLSKDKAGADPAKK